MGTKRVDNWGRVPRERAAWASFLRGFALLLALVPWPAAATCPGHQQAIVATPEGTFKLCPQTMDAGTPPQPVSLGFYSHCDVTGIWSGGSAVVTVTNPAPGVPVVVGFPAATGAGGATASCTNTNGATSPINASAITFKPAQLGPPKPPEMAP